MQIIANKHRKPKNAELINVNLGQVRINLFQNNFFHKTFVCIFNALKVNRYLFYTLVLQKIQQVVEWNQN